MRASARRQKTRLCAAPIFVLTVAALLADAVIAEGRVHRDLTLQTGHPLAAAYQEGRGVGLFWELDIGLAPQRSRIGR
jgi:hypothetical protein